MRDLIRTVFILFYCLINGAWFGMFHRVMDTRGKHANILNVSDWSLEMEQAREPIRSCVIINLLQYLTIRIAIHDAI